MDKSKLALQKYKPAITQYLIDFLNQENKLAKVNLDDPVFLTLKNFVIRGKMARGSLLLLTEEILDQKQTKKNLQKINLPLAAALELIQAGLLIHDDIIDQDEQRRGQASIWQYYHQQNKKSDLNYGKNQAICVGDLCFFLANQLIAQAVANLNMQSNQKLRKQSMIAQLINSEINQVILAEMLDTQLSVQKSCPSLEQIFEMNLYKTARYSFSLPLILAAYLSDSSAITIKKLDSIGEKIGLIFQIRDDYLGIFGNNKKTGKPILSDVREGKKTIFYYYLVKEKSLKIQEKQLLNNCFGQQIITKEQTKDLQKLFKQRTLKKIDVLIKKLDNETKNIIAELKNEELEKLLIEVLNFAIGRQN